MPSIVVSDMAYQAAMKAYGPSDGVEHLPDDQWRMPVTQEEIEAAKMVMLLGETYSDLLLRGARRRLARRGDGSELQPNVGITGVGT
jgi:hypothetical protein